MIIPNHAEQVSPWPSGAKTPQGTMDGCLIEPSLQRAMDSIPALTWVCRIDGVIDYVNPRWTTFTGTTLGSGLEWGTGGLIHPEDLVAFLESCRSSVEREADGRVEARLRSSAGEYKWFLHEVSVLSENGRVARIIGVATEVDRYRENEINRQRRERYLQDAQRLSHAGSFALNMNSRELRWSDETYRIYEYPADTKPTVELALARVHHDDRPALEVNLARRATTLEPLDLRYRLAFPDGRIKFIQVLGRPSESLVAGIEYTGALMDVTSAKLAEDEIHQAHAALAHANRIATMGELMASIAHEINQPLASIVLNGDVCLRLLAKRQAGAEDEVREALGDIISDAGRASDVVRRLRALSRKTDPEHVALSINEVVEDTVRLVHRELAKSRVAVSVDLDATKPAVIGDRVQLQQVLLNLIMNAIQSIAEGSSPSRDIAISTRSDAGRRVSLAVSDTGAGVARENLETVFMAFFTTRPEGLGLGLSICRSIVEAHGGELGFVNNPGGGATFTFTLQSAVGEAAAT